MKSVGINNNKVAALCCERFIIKGKLARAFGYEKHFDILVTMESEALRFSIIIAGHRKNGVNVVMHFVKIFHNKIRQTPVPKPPMPKIS